LSTEKASSVKRAHRHRDDKTQRLSLRSKPAALGRPSAFDIVPDLRSREPRAELIVLYLFSALIPPSKK
jgi:hypothetical protein